MWVVDRGSKRQCGDRPNPWHGHQPATDRIRSNRLKDKPVQLGRFRDQALVCMQQRLDDRRKGEVVGDQLVHPACEPTARDSTNLQTEGTEKATDRLVVALASGRADSQGRGDLDRTLDALSSTLDVGVTDLQFMITTFVQQRDQLPDFFRKIAERRG